ncbi:hypothetical protein DSL72_006213 [Monilinia vaccinii-corymbosi]|uniref:Uncharacterized protein n=1 Tax=Monilinia vaccinii-corymbosi TaxID=61207 RepID=A0A8A3PHV5_9HELO|nr:hypothetical protein DSL72_006213 [Monilinia vaccinii-corymbosi]
MLEKEQFWSEYQSQPLLYSLKDLC